MQTRRGFAAIKCKENEWRKQSHIRPSYNLIRINQPFQLRSPVVIGARIGSRAEGCVTCIESDPMTAMFDSFRISDAKYRLLKLPEYRTLKQLR